MSELTDKRPTVVAAGPDVWNAASRSKTPEFSVTKKVVPRFGEMDQRSHIDASGLSVSVGAPLSKAGDVGAFMLFGNGPLIQVDVGSDPNYVPGPGNVPTPLIKGQWALIDTGANYCGIQNTLALELGLPIVGGQEMFGTAGRYESPVYLAQIYLPALRTTIYGRFPGDNMSASPAPFRIILGRHFLRAFSLSYDGRTGKVFIGN